MNYQKAFNNKVLDILKKSPNSSASELIKKIENRYSGNKDYYSTFDSFGFKVGLGMIATLLVDQSNKELGYLAEFKYYPNNLFSEKPRVETLTSSSTPMSLNECYSYLAKEFIYRLIRTTNIDDIIAAE